MPVFVVWRCQFWYALGSLTIIVSLIGCSQSSTRVAARNGGPQNHAHAILALQGVPHTLLVATHYGIYRSEDGGQQWSEVAGDNGQPMVGLMAYTLTQSLVDPLRLYVLGIPADSGPTATPGLYTSADAGKTWTLATPFTTFPSDSLYTIGAGTASAGQLFAIVATLAAHGLYTSDDFGKHWRVLPQAPTSAPSGVRGDPLHPHRVLLWSSDKGFFASDDDGMTWTPSAGVSAGVYSMSIAAATIYATSDTNLFISQDGGINFTAVPTPSPLVAISVCASSPDHAYALTEQDIRFTVDGGQTWQPTTAASRQAVGIACDPMNADTVSIAHSYPLGVDVSSDGGKSWQDGLS